MAKKQEDEIYIPFWARGIFRAEQTEKGLKFIRITSPNVQPIAP